MALRNQLARELGHSSFFALQVADYGMTVKEMMALLDGTLAATAPLYDRPALLGPAHPGGSLQAAGPATAARALGGQPLGPELARPGRGRQPGQDAGRPSDAQWVLGSAEQFYVSLGFPRLPESFWQGIRPAARAGHRRRARRTPQASAWHIDGERDVRSLMNVEPNERWFGTAHHELGHIYYYLAYARPEVPFLLRTGANRAFHEAVGELARLASQQPPYLQAPGVLVRAGEEPDATSWLLSSAMDSIVFLAFAAGTMTHFEHDLYEAGLPAAEWQARWWQYSERYQGVEPPAPAPDRAVRRLHQEPPQRRPRPVLRLRPGHADQVPAARPHLPRRSCKQDVRACDYGAASRRATSSAACCRWGPPATGARS